jgi:hypothetical protein
MVPREALPWRGHGLDTARPVLRFPPANGASPILCQRKGCQMFPERLIALRSWVATPTLLTVVRAAIAAPPVPVKGV